MSVYWIKDKYNDLMDEAAALGATRHEDGITLVSAELPDEITSNYGGRLWLRVGYSDSHGHEGWVSFRSSGTIWGGSPPGAKCTYGELMHRSKRRARVVMIYLITLSAMASSVGGGTSRPSVLQS